MLHSFLIHSVEWQASKCMEHECAHTGFSGFMHLYSLLTVTLAVDLLRPITETDIATAFRGK